MLALALGLLLVSPTFLSEAHGQTVVQITQSWLNQQLVAWKPTQNGSMSFGGILERASYGSLETSYNTAQVQTADLGMLTDAGASCVRVDLNYGPWLAGWQDYITEMGSVINQIRDAGHCLIIADAGSESYLTTPIPWSQFQTAWIQRVQTIAALYHPEYYIVIKEPQWYAPMVSDSATNPAFTNASDWLTLTQELVNAVASVSPVTKIGVSVPTATQDGTFYQQYLAGLEKMSGISMIGFDIYTATGFQDVLSFLSSTNMNGKKLWIAEAWSTSVGSTAFNKSRASLDKEWMLVLYYFALKVHAQIVIPFYTDIFSSYNPWPTTSSSIISTYQTKTTPVYFEYNTLATDYGVAP